METEHRLLRYFSWLHLPNDLQPMSKRFHTLAREIVNMPGVVDPAEQTVALRKLLEAKDAAVRMMLK